MVEHVVVDFRVVSSSPMLSVEIIQRYLKKKDDAVSFVLFRFPVGHCDFTKHLRRALTFPLGLRKIVLGQWR